MTAPLRNPVLPAGGPSSPARLSVPGSPIHARFTGLAPLVEAALPGHDATPQSARAIFGAVRFGCLQTTRNILRGIAAEGRATVTHAPYRRTGTIKLYRRAALPAPVSQENDA